MEKVSKALEKKIEKDNKIRNIALQSQIPTTIDIVNDQYGQEWNPDTQEFDAVERYTYETGEQSYYTTSITGEKVFSYSLPVYYRISTTTGESTIIKDKELLTDLYVRNYFEKKSKVTDDPRHDFLYPPSVNIDVSTASYVKENKLFVYNVDSNGDLMGRSSRDVANALSAKYDEWNFESAGPGKIKITTTNPNSGKKLTLSYRKGGFAYSKPTVQSVEQFKLDLVKFINQNGSPHTDNTSILQKQKREEIYDKFYGEGGVATTYNKTQLREIERLEIDLATTLQDKILQAKKGKLVIWPTDFTHPHKGVISHTEEKYIATGWFELI